MYSRDQIIEEIRRIAAKLNAKSVKQADFRQHSKISLSTVRYHFATWNKAVAASGLRPFDPTESLKNKKSLSDHELLSELLRLYNETGKEPTLSEVNANGKYSVKPYNSRWGSIHKAFLLAAKSQSQSNKADSVTNQGSDSDEIKLIPETIKPKEIKKRITIYGEPINFRGLTFAPVNEQGVVYLFGMISKELGFLIESVRTDYPDCEGKRCFDKTRNQWEHVRIEFEYCSQNFQQHGHSPEECDIIVCWLHDWTECPIEVLELRTVIRHL